MSNVFKLYKLGRLDLTKDSSWWKSVKEKVGALPSGDVSCTANAGGSSLNSSCPPFDTTCVTSAERETIGTFCLEARGQRYVLIIHFYVESGQKMIQFNIQFKIESKIFIQ